LPVKQVLKLSGQGSRPGSRRQVALGSEAKTKVKYFNSQFCSVYVSEDMNSIPSLGPRTIPDIELLIFSCNGVKKQPQSLKDDKAPGPDKNESGIFLIVESINQSINNLFTHVNA